MKTLVIYRLMSQTTRKLFYTQKLRTLIKSLEQNCVFLQKKKRNKTSNNNKVYFL